jgi:hypothetical protein
LCRDYWAGGLVGELSEDSSEVEFELGLGLDPERPVDELQKLSLKQVHLLKRDAAHIGQEVIAIEDIIVELGGEQDSRENEPIKARVG